VAFLKEDNSKHYKDQDLFCAQIVQSKIGGEEGVAKIFSNFCVISVPELLNK